ncbi:MAG: amidohydrolase family protein [Bacillota bacterium]
MSSYTVIRAGSLIDGSGADPVSPAVVVIRDGRVVAAGRPDEVEYPPDSLVYDAGGRTVMPGLIDSHVHITGSGEASWMETVKYTIPYTTLRAAVNARATLEAGITAIRDAGAGWGIDVGLKRAINEGRIPGPRMVVSGPGLSITGGHGDPANGWPPEVVFRAREMSVVDSPDQARRAARTHLRDGADCIKLLATGGVLSEGDLPTSRGLTIEEMRAAIEEAHNLGKKTLAHAQGSTGIRNAILAGIDSIEHGCYLTEEIIEMMLARGVFLVPTLSAVHHIVERGAEAGIPPYAVEKARRMQEDHFRSFRMALEAGVRIAMGTDAATPFNYHGDNALELELMVKAGMTPVQAIVAATARGAELLGLETGVLAPGRLADLLVVDGNPLEEISCLQHRGRILLVMKGGEVQVNRGLRPAA